MAAGSWLYPLNGADPEIHDDIISLNLDEYLDLVDWTGRQIVDGNEAKIYRHPIIY